MRIRATHLLGRGVFSDLVQFEVKEFGRKR